MKKISVGIVEFFHKQPYTIITTIDKKGFPHSSCKGLVDINKEGNVYLLDLYKGKTYKNLKHNTHISITAVDEHTFVAFSLKGKAKIVKKEQLDTGLIKLWDTKLTKRITQRLIKSVQGQKGHHRHPEALLPKPEYLIEVDVEEVVNLTPKQIT